MRPARSWASRCRPSAAGYSRIRESLRHLGCRRAVWTSAERDRRDARRSRHRRRAAVSDRPFLWDWPFRRGAPANLQAASRRLGSCVFRIVRTRQLRDRDAELAEMVATGLQRVPAHDRSGMIGLIHGRVQLDVIEEPEIEPLLAEFGPDVGIGAVAAILVPGALGKVPLVEDPGRHEGSVPIEHEALEVEGLALSYVPVAEHGTALAPDPAHALVEELGPAVVRLEIGGSRHLRQAQRRLRRAAFYGNLARKARQHEIATVPVREEGKRVMAGDERGLAHADGLAAPLPIVPERVVERRHAALAEAGGDGFGEVAQEEALLQGHVLHGGDDALAADDVLAQSHDILSGPISPDTRLPPYGDGLLRIAHPQAAPVKADASRSALGMARPLF